MKIIRYLIIFSFFVLNCVFNEAFDKKKSNRLSKVPSSIWKASNFISEFHKKFVKDVFQKINHPYLTSITDEDIPDINVVNALASVVMVDTQAHLHANNTTSNNTQITEESYESDKKFKANCEIYNYTGSPTVEIVNLTRFYEVLISDSNITKRVVAAPCIVALFYAPSCPFSAMAAPHFNALARAFPTVKMIAVNTKKYQIINSQFGIVGVPTVMLFHNGRALLKFNRRPYTLAQFSKFITLTTGITADSKMFVASTDFGGPLSGIPIQESDYALPLSWFVIVMWMLKFVLDNRWIQSLCIPFRRQMQNVKNRINREDEKSNIREKSRTEINLKLVKRSLFPGFIMNLFYIMYHIFQKFLSLF